MQIDTNLAMLGTVAIIALLFLVIFFNPEKLAKIKKLKIWIFDAGIETESHSPDTSPTVDHDQDTDPRKSPEAMDESDESTVERSASPFLRIVIAGFDKDRTALEVAYGEAKSSPHYLEEQESVESHYLKAKLSMGDADAVTALRELLQEHARWVQPALILSKYYDDLGVPQKSIEILESVVSRAEAGTISTVYERLLAVVSKTSGPDAALRRGRLLMRDVADPILQGNLAIDLATVANAANRKALSVHLLEFSALKNPENFSGRFRAAYAIGEIEFYAPLSLFHYFSLRKVAPETDFTINNIAAYFSQRKEPLAYGYMMSDAATHTPAFSYSNLAIHAASQGLFEAAEQFLGNASEAMKAGYVRPEDQEKYDGAVRYLSDQRLAATRAVEKAEADSQVWGQYFSENSLGAISKWMNEEGPNISGVWVDVVFDKKLQIDVVSSQKHELTYIDGATTYNGFVYGDGVEWRGSITKSVKESINSLLGMMRNEKTILFTGCSSDDLDVMLVSSDSSTERYKFRRA